MDTMSTPSRSADSACRTDVHLWTTAMPCALNVSMYSRGLRPAVSTTRMPLSTMAATYSAYGGGFTDGSSVRFTPKGLSVSARVRRDTGDREPAPLAVLAAVYEGTQLPMDRALALEAKFFGRLVADPVARDRMRAPAQDNPEIR